MDFEKNIVVFDWDGTILKNTRANFLAANAALVFLGKNPVSLAAYRQAHQVPTRAMFEALGCSGRDLEERKDAFLKAFYETYQRNAVRLELRKGARSVLETLRINEIPTAVWSNSSVGKIERAIQKTLINCPFQTILANEVSGTAFHTKKGTRLEAFLNGQKIRDAIIVGDTVEEVAIARENGCVAVALSGGACSTERLARENPDFLIKDIKGLLPIVSKIFGCAL